MSSVNERLRLARENAGLSQGQVAKKLSMSRPTITEMEAGRRKVTAEEVGSLASIYDVSVEWLVNGTEKGSESDGRLQLAARGLASLRPDDLDKVLRVLKTMRRKSD